MPSLFPRMPTSHISPRASRAAFAPRISRRFHPAHLAPLSPRASPRASPWGAHSPAVHLPVPPSSAGPLFPLPVRSAVCLVAVCSPGSCRSPTSRHSSSAFCSALSAGLCSAGLIRWPCPLASSAGLCSAGFASLTCPLAGSLLRRGLALIRLSASPFACLSCRWLAPSSWAGCPPRLSPVCPLAGSPLRRGPCAYPPVRLAVRLSLPSAGLPIVCRPALPPVLAVAPCSAAGEIAGRDVVDHPFEKPGRAGRGRLRFCRRGVLVSA